MCAAWLSSEESGGFCWKALGARANLSQGGRRSKHPIDSQTNKEPRSRVHACFVDALNRCVFFDTNDRQQQTIMMWIVVAMVIVVVVAELGGHPSTSYSQATRTTHSIKNTSIVSTNLNIGHTDS